MKVSPELVIIGFGILFAGLVILVAFGIIRVKGVEDGDAREWRN